MKKTYFKRVLGFLTIVLITVSGNLYAESSSFGNAFITKNDEFSMVVARHSFAKKGNDKQSIAIDSDLKMTHSLFNFSINSNLQGFSDVIYLNDYLKIYKRTVSVFPAINNFNVVLPVAIEVSNTCPASTVDLNSYVNSTPPAGSTLSWHTGTPATLTNMITPTQAMAISTTSGPYYPAYYDASGTGCFSPTGSPIQVTIILCCTLNPPTLASGNIQPTCSVPTGTINITPQTGAEYSVDGNTYQSSPIFSGLIPGSYTLYVRNITNHSCISQSIAPITINEVPTATVPNLTVSGAICNGSTYNVSFNSNGIVTASTGVVSGNTIIGIAVGTDVILTATSTNGCASTQTTVNSPTSCTNPPIGCTTPTISAGNGVCSGTGTYSISVTVSAGAVIEVSSGVVSGNSVTGIAIGTPVTITAKNGTCSNSVKVASPTDCTTPCAGTAVSYSIGSCTGTTYSVSISNPNAATIAASAGTITPTAITNIPVGTDVTLTATANGCNPEIVTLNSPKATAPNLTVSGAICNGTTYEVSFNSNGVVTASTGVVSGNTITGIAVGTDVILTATATNGCASTQTTVNSPTSCTNPPIGCTTPTISAGNGVCSGMGTYSVSVTVSAGAVIETSSGVVSGNSVTGIAIGTAVTITAKNGTCTNSVKVASPTDCTTPCAGTAVSYSIGSCTGTTYSVSISNPNGATIAASAGTVTSTAITNIPIGTDVTLTATATGCNPEIVTLSSPSSCLIDAVDDMLTAVSGVAPSVITNDTLRGAPAVIGTETGQVKLTSTATSQLSINPVTGVITVAANTPVGTYTIPYTICEVVNPANCDTATATVTVKWPDFTPTIEIDDTIFLSSGETRDFVVNIFELAGAPSLGQVAFVIPKISAFTITYNATSTLSNVFGGVAVYNNDWTITENPLFIKGILKPNIVIGANLFSRIGFTITRKSNIPDQTSQNLTSTVQNSSGSDSVNSNNTYNVLVKAQ